MGALNEQAALSCSRDKDVAHSLPDGRGRKEGRQGGVCRENMFLWLRKEDCWKGRGALGPRESNSISWPHSLSPVLLPCSSLSLLLASSVVPHFLRATMVFVRN